MKLGALSSNLSPTLLLLGIAVLIVLIFALILFVLWRTKKKQEAAGAEAQAQEPAKEDAAPQAEPSTAVKPAVASVSEAQTRSSVGSAVQFLKANTAGLGGKYRTPWFLVLGASGSGKSTLLDHSGISLSLREGATDFGVGQGIQWRFFDGGVILDVPGNFFLRADHTGSDERNWKALLRNVERNRPQRPIDGVVLTIPCTELFGDTAVSPAVIGQRAAQIFDKLWQIQKWSGLCFPVYVVVTKCDLVPGFKSLARQLPSHYRREMFGWSNPYNLEAAFEAGWVDQGFEELTRQVNRLQSEVLVARHGIADVDELFLFSGKLQELRRPLRIYLGQIFKHSAYRESLQFRGFYFAGDATEKEEQGPELPRAMAAAASHSGSSMSVDDDYLPVTGDVLGLTPALHAEPQPAPIFVTDLFESKVFPERGLAKPVSRVHLSKNRWVLSSQAACIVAVVLLVAGVWFNYFKLAKGRAEYVPMLDNVYEELTKMENRENSTALTAEENDSAHYLLRVVQSSSGNRFRTIFYPTSLIAPLEKRLQEAMVPVFKKLVLVSFRQQLLKKGDLLGSTTLTRSCPQGPASALAQQDAYQQLCGFTSELLLLEQNIDMYNRVSSRGQGNSHEIARLEEYLSGRQLPESFVENHNPYFDLALKQSSGEPIDRKDVNQNGAVVAMKDLTRGLFQQWFPKNPLLFQLDWIRQKIDNLDEVQTASDLITLSNSLKQVHDETGSPEFTWVGRNDFQLTPDLGSVTTDVVNKSQYFLVDNSESLRAFINQTGKQEFAEFRGRRDSARTRLTGELLRFENGTVQLAANADTLRTYLDDLLKQPFAQRDLTDQINTSIDSKQELLWNKDLLQEATGMPEQYQHFIKPELANAPAEMQHAFQQIAEGRLESNIMELIAQAQKFQPLPSSEDVELAIVPELQSFQESAGDFSSLLEHLQELGLTDAYDDLLKTTVSQASNLLRRIDNSYEAQSPYGTTGGSFNRWNGENTAAWAGFDAHNGDEVTQYVLFQRQQAQQYAAKATPLVDFLSTRVSMNGKDPGRTVVKWQGIVSDLQKYASKVPGTSLAGLEDFIGVDVPKVASDNCQAGFLTTAAVGSNYFAQRQEALRRSLYSRCRFLSEQNAVREYAGIAKFFNDNLAGKFPFSGPPREQLPSEADPLDVVKLYGMVDSFGKPIRAGLQKGDFGDSYSQVLDFLNQLDGLRPVFGSLLAGQQDPVPILDIVPAFRVNQSREINGNQIIDWSLQVGADTFRYHDPERAGRWNFGDPVKLVLRWAKDSPQQPTSARRPVDGRLNSRTVTFEYHDSWSLFSMLALHRPAANDFDRMVDPDPQTLVFAVNDTKSSDPVSASTGSNPETKVFVRIRLRAPGKAENLRLRPFPTEAPELDQTRAQAGAGGNHQ
jgi:type VI secretion system protein ImpL